MQNNTVSQREPITLYQANDNSFVQEKNAVSTYTHRNAAAVPRLTLKDKAGLVFVVMILLMLQLLEKLKVIK